MPKPDTIPQPSTQARIQTSTQTIVNTIIKQLEVDLAMQIQAAKDAHEAATHSESVAENKYDTFGLESSYLAQGQQKRVEQINQALIYFCQLTFNDNCAPNADSQLIAPLSLITLKAIEDEQILTFFLANHSGGLKINVNGLSMRVLTPESPLGCALLDKEIGDDVEMMIKGVMTSFEITAVELASI